MIQLSPTRRRWSLLIALVFLVIGIMGQIVLLFYSQLAASRYPDRAAGRGAAQQAVTAAQAGWQKERAKLFMDREELALQVEQATGRVAQLDGERTNLLDRMKVLLKERNDARDEVNRLRQDLVTVGTTMAQLTDEAGRLKQEIQTRDKRLETRDQGQEGKEGRADVQRRGEQVWQDANRQTAQQMEKAQRQFTEVLRRKGQALEEVNAELTKTQGALAQVNAELTRSQAALGKAEKQVKATAARAEEQVNVATAKAEEQVKTATQAAVQVEARLRQELAQAQEALKRQQEALKRQAGELAAAQKRALAQQATDLKRGFAQTETTLTLQLQQAQHDLKQAQARQEVHRIELERLRADLTDDWAALYVRVGLLEIAQGNVPAAEAAFKQAIAIQPSMGTAHYNLAVLYDDYLKKPEAAAREYEQYLLLTPHAKDAATVRGWVQTLKAQHLSESQRQTWNRPGPSGIGKTLKQILQ